MRKSLFCFVCLLFCSCNDIWIGTPSYVGKWKYGNATNTELIVYMECTGINELGEKCSEVTKNVIPGGKELWNIFESFNPEDLNFYKHFLRIKETHSCKVWLTNTSGSMLKLWVMGEDNGPHDIFDEKEWKCGEQSEYSREWTFTITDADIAVE